MSSPMRVSIILLAAGSASRFGSPKQLLPYNGTTLLRYMTGVALDSSADNVVVVLGFDSSRMRTELHGLSMEIVENPDWKLGMSSSVRKGIHSLTPDIDAAIIMLCDQPKVTSNLLNTLIKEYERTRASIITCRYGGSVGVPTLYDRTLFPELLKLQGDGGGKPIIEKNVSGRIEIDFPDGAYDIDTHELLEQ